MILINQMDPADLLNQEFQDNQLNPIEITALTNQEFQQNLIDFMIQRPNHPNKIAVPGVPGFPGVPKSNYQTEPAFQDLLNLLDPMDLTQTSLINLMTQINQEDPTDQNKPNDLFIFIYLFNFICLIFFKF